MKVTVVGGSYTRFEGKDEERHSVTYPYGAQIIVSEKELAAFPTTFAPIIIPRTEADEIREKQLEGENTLLKAQVTSLTKERDDLKKEVDTASKASGGTATKAEVTRLKAENAELKTKLEQAEAAAAQAQTAASDSSQTPAPQEPVSTETK